MCPQETRLQLMCTRFLVGTAPECQRCIKRKGVGADESRNEELLRHSMRLSSILGALPHAEEDQEKNLTQDKAMGAVA